MYNEDDKENKILNIVLRIVTVIVIILGIIVSVATIRLCAIDRKSDNNQFIKVSNGYHGHYDVLYDKDTHVMYVDAGRGGFTLMVDEDGNPKIYDESQD